LQISTSSATLKLESPRLISLITEESQFELKNNAEIHSKEFSVVSGDGSELLKVSKDGIKLGTTRLAAPTASIGDSLQTENIMSPAGKSLSIEAPTSNIDFFGPSGVKLKADGGNISMFGYSDIKLGSSKGQIILNTGKIVLPRVPIVDTNISANNYKTYTTTKDISIYQVCVCGSGKVFLAPANRQCDSNTDLCRY